MEGARGTVLCMNAPIPRTCCCGELAVVHPTGLAHPINGPRPAQGRRECPRNLVCGCPPGGWHAHSQRGHTAPYCTLVAWRRAYPFSAGIPYLTPSRFPFYPAGPPRLSRQLPYINALSLSSSPPSLQQPGGSQQRRSGAHRQDTVTALGELCEAREEVGVEHGLTRTEAAGPAGGEGTGNH